MSISAALSNAVSGLTAVSRSAELVSANVANAMTEGYGRRELNWGANVVGGQGAGVTVIGIDRAVNEAALSDRRLSDAALGFHQSHAAFFSEMERTIGSPELEGSLSAHFARFDQSLIVAAGDPSSETKLASVLDTSISLAAKFNAISEKLQAERQHADTTIGKQVTQANQALEDIHSLNLQIRHQLVSGGSAAGLMDQRQVAIDQVAELLPIRSVQREYGQVALVTLNGSTLVDYSHARFEFQVTPTITPDSTLASGALSGLVISGGSSSNGSALEAVAGGALAASFALRDQEIPALQDNIDALALDLAQRASGADAALAPGLAGLFSDVGGIEATVTDVLGLAGRLQVNPAVDPANGGQLWRIRDGATAVVAGPASDRTLLNALSSSVTGQSQPVSGTFNSAGSISELLGGFLSDVGQSRQSALTRQGFQAAQSQAFRDLELEGGVDTDQEMQKLLLIEQNFSANAKVIQAMDEMLQSILRI